MNLTQDGKLIEIVHFYLLDFLWFLSLWHYLEGIIERNFIIVQIHQNESN